MHYSSLTSVAFLALATLSAADQVKVFTRSNVSLSRVGPFRRQANDGYQPEDEVCNGGGATCASACGAGYQQCTSTDASVHCFNPAAGESCCSTGTGSSCLAGFYCTHDSQVQTWCCTQGKNLGECATEFGVTGALTSDIPRPTTTSTTSTTSSTTSSIVETTSSETTTAAPTTTSIVAGTNSTSSRTTGPTGSRTTAPPSSTTTSLNAAFATAPAAALAMAVAGLAAALL